MSDNFVTINLKTMNKSDILTKLLIMNDGTILLSRLTNVLAEDIGGPDIVLIEPCLVEKTGEKYVLTPWLFEFADVSQNQFYIHSDKILTMATPNPILLELYNKRFA